MARAIRKARTDVGLTPKALAERLGVDLSEVSRLENGKGNPQWGTVKRVAYALTCHSPSWPRSPKSSTVASATIPPRRSPPGTAR